MPGLVAGALEGLGVLVAGALEGPGLAVDLLAAMAGIAELDACLLETPLFNVNVKERRLSLIWLGFPTSLAMLTSNCRTDLGLLQWTNTSLVYNLCLGNDLV